MRPRFAIVATKKKAGLALALFASACGNPRTEANVASALNDAAGEISALRSEVAAIQSQLDSLQTVIAKQDTTISHIAAVNNIPIAK